MLKRLGITRFVYDWRDKDIPSFDQEVDALEEYGIKLQGFWLTSGLEPAQEKNMHTVLDLWKRRKRDLVSAGAANDVQWVAAGAKGGPSHQSRAVPGGGGEENRLLGGAL
jgi:hypothetical protein